MGDDGSPTGCPPCPYPYAQVCMMTPPPCVLPTQPKYVKPLELPQPKCNKPKKRCPDEDFQNRIANFYNNYNVDYHEPESKPTIYCPTDKPCKTGVTVGGKNPNCEDYMLNKNQCNKDKGCPTGYKPCTMKLCPPPCCDPLLPWKAVIQPCPPKSKKKDITYRPGECTRPCCKHWKPKEPPCIWPCPCKASCFNYEPRSKCK